MPENIVYEPDEDSFLLEQALLAELTSYLDGKDSSSISLLDMGAGSGYLGFSAKKFGLRVTLVDNNPLAITAMKLFAESEDISVIIIESDLFEKVPAQQFNVIVFNTPYLPNDDGMHDPSLHGGPKGNEITLDFLEQMQKYLTEKGFTLILTSSLAHPKEVEEKLSLQGWTCQRIASKKLFFEELIVYKLTRQNG